MEYRRLGNAGIKLSAVGLGTWVTFGQQVDAKQADRLIGTAFDLGINFIDTADVYAGGKAEEMLGKVLKGGPRPAIVLASKLFGRMGDGPNDHGLSRKHIIEGCEASLRRLGVDYLDLYQCHRFDIDTPLEEVLAGMDHLVRQGKVLYWGVSQWPAVQIAEATQLADRHGLSRPASNQPLYNLFNRTLEIDVMRTCERHGLGIVCYSPLAQGILTGKYARGERPAGSRASDPTTGQWMERRMPEENLGKAARLAAIARPLGVAPGQLALAAPPLFQYGNQLIVGATSVEQLKDNAGAAAIRLDDQVIDDLEEVFDSAPRDQYTGVRIGYGHESWGW